MSVKSSYIQLVMILTVNLCSFQWFPNSITEGSYPESYQFYI